MNSIENISIRELLSYSYATQLKELGKHWEEFACMDPFCAILSHPGKDGGRWDIDDFFSRSESVLDSAIMKASQRDSALDFG